MKPDGLTRISGDLSSQGDERYQAVSMLIKSYNIIGSLMDSPPGQGRKPLETLWKEGIAANNWPAEKL